MVHVQLKARKNYGARSASERILTFSMIRNKLIMRLKQYVRRPKATRQISATWSPHISCPTDVSSGSGGGWGSLLYHDMLDGDAQGMSDVKKLSKQRERAADHAQIKSVSERV